MLRVLFVSFALPFFPEASGGGCLSTLELLRRLRRKGCSTEVVAKLGDNPLLLQAFQHRNGYELARFGGRLSFFVKDERLGFPCWRGLTDEEGARRWLQRHVAAHPPHMILGAWRSSPLLSDLSAQGYPCFYFIHDVDRIQLAHPVPRKVHLIANSPFAAKLNSQRHRKAVRVIFPFINRKKYQVRRRIRRFITFVNPIPEKGLGIVSKLAKRLHDRQFLFVKDRSPVRESQNATQLEPFRRPNVEVWDFQSDMRRVYEQTDVLLVPSQCQETFGRVIVEAHLNGIPVVASDTGGIPYTLGEGGILIHPKDDVGAYEEALRRLHTDSGLYSRLSRRALQNSLRPDFDPEVQLENFLRFVAEKVERRSIRQRLEKAFSH